MAIARASLDALSFCEGMSRDSMNHVIARRNAATMTRPGTLHACIYSHDRAAQ